MAVVRITSGLVEQVKYAASQAYNSKVAHASTIPPGKFEEVYNLLLPEDTRKKMTELPVLFFITAQTMRVRLAGNTMRLHNDSGKIVPMPCVLPKDLCGLTENCSFDGHININALDTRWTDFIAWHEAWLANKEAARSEQKHAENTAAAFLRRHKSLAPALLEWPALWELLPAWAKNQHGKEVERKPRQKKAPVPPPDVDEEALMKLGAGLMLKNITGKDML